MTIIAGIPYCLSRQVVKEEFPNLQPVVAACESCGDRVKSDGFYYVSNEIQQDSRYSTSGAP
jgi:hypothetical protein